MSGRFDGTGPTSGKYRMSPSPAPAGAKWCPEHPNVADVTVEITWSWPAEGIFNRVTRREPGGDLYGEIVRVGADEWKITTRAIQNCDCNRKRLLRLEMEVPESRWHTEDCWKGKEVPNEVFIHSMEAVGVEGVDVAYLDPPVREVL